MKNLLAITFMLAITVASCGCSKKPTGTDHVPISAVETVPPDLFGANMAWENLSDNSITGAELLRDRSFRINSSGLSDMLGNTAPTVWQEYANGGTIGYSTTGGDNPSGEKSYPGYAVLSRSTGDGAGGPSFTGFNQILTEGVKQGHSYNLEFSSYGDGSSYAVMTYLYTVSPTFQVISNSDFQTSQISSWKRHTVTLNATQDASSAYLFVLLVHPGTDSLARSVWIDEVRLTDATAIPQIKTSVRSSILDLGIKSLRWPGGTLIDFFSWKDSVGSFSARGELKSSNSYQTPSFGLHEFLNFCESNGITPVLQVNFLNGSSDAADLVEYVLGAPSTIQGAIRAANGRSQPWNVRIFEIGNEPSASYKGGGSTENAGLAYAAAAKPVIAAVKAKAAALGKTVRVNGIIEPTFELADWLAGFAANPDPAYDVVRLIYNWNSQALGSSGIGAVDFLDGHFYGYQKFDPAMSEAQAFPYVMANGALLEKTLTDKIVPLSTLPVWITEFNIYPKEDNTNIVHTDRMMDFQSGLAVGDILNSMIRYKIQGAQVWNLAQPWFGLIQNPDTGNMRPSAYVFKLFSAMAGEERLNVTVDSTETVNVGTGSGSVPTGLTYPLISAIATKTSSGKARIILINRSYTQSKTVNLTFDSPITGTADIYRYENTDLAANNENGNDNVAIVSSTAVFGAPFTVMLQPHSIMRIDMR
jgi:alpha-L-arabinofuranosidase